VPSSTDYLAIPPSLFITIIGVAKAGRTDEQLKERARDSVHQQGGSIDEDALAKLLNLLRYVGGDYEEFATFDRCHCVRPAAGSRTLRAGMSVKE
jgi:glucose-6-phosphate 1-dehydrogenase